MKWNEFKSMFKNFYASEISFIAEVNNLNDNEIISEVVVGNRDCHFYEISLFK